LLKKKLERFDATQIENYNTLPQYTVADPRYAVSRHIVCRSIGVPLCRSQQCRRL